MVCDDVKICKKGSRILFGLFRGDKLFTSGAVGIAKLELARGIRKTLNTTVVEPTVRMIPDMLLDPLLITSMTDGIEFEMPRALSKRFATKFPNKHPV